MLGGYKGGVGRNGDIYDLYMYEYVCMQEILKNKNYKIEEAQLKNS